MKTVSRRERQILDILYRLGKATASDIQAALPGSPSNSTTRTLLRVLEEKGHVKHQQDGVRYVFLPVAPRNKARIEALRHLLETFFEGSALNAAEALVDGSAAKLTEEDLKRLETMVARARKEKADL